MLELFRFGKSLIWLALHFSSPVQADPPMLRQQQLADVTALVRQHASATPALQKEATAWSRMAEEDVRRQRWDRAAKAFGEVALRDPTFGALKRYAESVMHANRRRDSIKESLEMQRMAFKTGSTQLKIALDFARQTEFTVPPGELQDIQREMACVDSYLAREDPFQVPSCEPVKSLTDRYRTVPAK